MKVYLDLLYIYEITVEFKQKAFTYLLPFSLSAITKVKYTRITYCPLSHIFLGRVSGTKRAQSRYVDSREFVIS